MSRMDFTENKAAERLLKRKDETGMMSRSVASLRKEMVLMIQDIQAQSNSLFNASESLDKDATHTARAIEQVESAVGDIASGATNQADETQCDRKCHYDGQYDRRNEFRCRSIT